MTKRSRHPRAEVERQVTAMLVRRAEDIGPEHDGPALPPVASGSARAIGPTTPDRPRPRRLAPPMMTAGAALVVLLGVGGLVWFTDRPPSESPLTVEAGGDEPSATGSTGSTGEDRADDAGPGAPLDGDTTATLADVVETLPENFDLDGRSALWVGAGDETDPERAAAGYLADRLPDLSVEILATDSEARGEDRELHLIRWQLAEDEIQDLAGVGGWVIVALDSERAGVVAATTDGTTLTTLDRTDGQLSVVATDEWDEDLVADVTDLWGQPVPQSPDPTGLGAPDLPPFGTAGSSAGDRLTIETEIPPWPVAIRIQHVGGTWLSITEAVVEPTAFARSCGADPPVAIEVADRLGPLVAGASGRSSLDPIPEQGVWHHPATEASKQTAVEVRWPPDPSLAGRLPLESFGPDQTATMAVGPSIISSDPRRRITGQSHTIIAVGPEPATDPCHLVQLSVLGDPATADWWAGAFAGQRSFGLPLGVAGPDLDPLIGPDGGAGPDESRPEELVVDVVEQVALDAVPRVPATGSCDGLPDDPPRRGTDPGPVRPLAEAALIDFLTTTGSTLDPPLPTSGYVEYRTTGGSSIYIVPSGETAITTVTVELVDDGWRVAGWEAARC